MNGGPDLVAGLGGANGEVGAVQIPDLTDHDDVRIASKRREDGLVEAGEPILGARRDGELLGVADGVLGRVLDGDDGDRHVALEDRGLDALLKGRWTCPSPSPRK